LAGKKARQHIVGVGRQHDLSDRQTHAFREQRSGGVAEVAGGYDQIQYFAMMCVELQRGVRVVRNLRQQAAQADTVGRGQRHAFAQIAVG
jgi:hypothetical protein